MVTPRGISLRHVPPRQKLRKRADKSGAPPKACPTRFPRELRRGRQVFPGLACGSDVVFRAAPHASATILFLSLRTGVACRGRATLHTRPVRLRCFLHLLWQSGGIDAELAQLGIDGLLQLLRSARLT